MINADTVIVVIHRGRSWYLPYCLNQAKHKNPQRRVMLIGDANNRYKDCNHIDVSKLKNKESKTFKELYTHMSTNGQKFETFCWLRWYYILEYMRTEGITSILHLDSDVLLYSSLEVLEQLYSVHQKSCGLMISDAQAGDHQWFASGHSSFWTIEALTEFCQFSIKSYKDKTLRSRYEKKWQYHLESGQSGGICDMSTLYLFAQRYQEQVLNLAKPVQSTVFDFNVASPEGTIPHRYETSGLTKRLAFLKGLPHFQSQTGDQHQAHTLHFQGSSKQLMRKYYDGPNRLEIVKDRIKHLLKLS